MTSLEDRLRAVPFFRALPADDLAAISQQLQQRSVRKGAVLFREGDDADAMYLVDSGQLEVLRGRESKPVALLGAGSVAGELALLLGEPRSATLRAASACRLWSLSRRDLDALLTAHPAIALELSAELGRRLVTTTERLAHGETTRVTVALGAAAARLAEALVAEGVRARVVKPPLDARGHKDGDHIVVALPRTRSAASAQAVDAAQWVVTTGDVPEWIARRHAPDRILRIDPTFSSTAAAARRVSGRAVGVAFSSGGSKTVAHAGVVAALHERGVRIDAVAGSSGGALVAAGLAAGASPTQIIDYTRQLALQLRRRKWDVHIVPRTGLMKGRRLYELFERWFEGREFSDLSIPLLVVASDVLTGEEVVISKGSVASALRASLSIPAAFDPWRHDGRLLIDGGVTNPLPAGPLRQAGFERIIASNVAGKDVDMTAKPGDKLPSILMVLLRTINLMEAEAIKAHIPLADIVIRPVVKASSSFDFSSLDLFVAEGRAATERQDDELRRLGFSQV